MLPVSVRIHRVDQRISTLAGLDDPLAALELDDLLDKRSKLMDERDRGWRFTDRRRFARRG